MLKNLKIYLLSLSAFLLTFVAMSGVSVACAGWIYEPDIPQSLKRDL